MLKWWVSLRREREKEGDREREIREEKRERERELLQDRESLPLAHPSARATYLAQAACRDACALGGEQVDRMTENERNGTELCVVPEWDRITFWAKSEWDRIYLGLGMSPNLIFMLGTRPNLPTSNRNETEFKFRIRRNILHWSKIFCCYNLWHIGVASARGCTQQFSAEYRCRTRQICYAIVMQWMPRPLIVLLNYPKIMRCPKYIRTGSF
jgi:hypothetical protein